MNKNIFPNILNNSNSKKVPPNKQTNEEKDQSDKNNKTTKSNTKDDSKKKSSDDELGKFLGIEDTAKLPGIPETSKLPAISESSKLPGIPEARKLPPLSALSGIAETDHEIDTSDDDTRLDAGTSSSIAQWIGGGDSNFDADEDDVFDDDDVHDVNPSQATSDGEELYLSVDVTDDIMQLYEFFDRGSDGGLTVDDIIGAYRIFNIEIDIEEAMFIVEAFNKSAKVNEKEKLIRFHDFHREMYEVMLRGTREEHIRMIFDSMDTNYDGLIGPEEIIRLFERVSGEALDEESAVKYADEISEENSYGLIEYHQFRQFVISMDNNWHATVRKRSPTFSERSNVRSRNNSIANSEVNVRKTSVATSEPSPRKPPLTADVSMRRHSIATSEIDIRKNSKDNLRKTSSFNGNETILRKNSIVPKESNSRKSSVAPTGEQNQRKMSTVIEPVFE